MYFLFILYTPYLVYIPSGDLSAMIQTPALSVLEADCSPRLICDACIYDVSMVVYHQPEFSSSIVQSHCSY